MGLNLEFPEGNEVRERHGTWEVVCGKVRKRYGNIVFVSLSDKIHILLYVETRADKRRVELHVQKKGFAPDSFL